MEAGKERLTREAVRDATQHEVEALRRENVELKQLVAELSLERYRLRLLQDPDDLLPCVPLPCHQPSLSILFYRRTLLLTDTVFGGRSAIQHAMAALECVAREVTGGLKSTLGRIINDNPELLPAPLDQTIESAWGYASDRARHIREGSVPSYEEADRQFHHEWSRGLRP